MNLLFSCATGAVAVAIAASAVGADGAPSAVRGRQLFIADGCVNCHGTEGQGSASGARLAALNLPAPAIASFVRATTTGMPAYSAQVLSDANIADIAAFLATIRPAKPADSIPALKSLKAP